jgi:hypothetical protein
MLALASTTAAAVQWNYTHINGRKYDINAIPTPAGVEWAGTGPAWDSGPAALCGKPALTPPHEAGAARPMDNGFICYDGYGILPKNREFLEDAFTILGIPKAAFPGFTGEFIQPGSVDEATEGNCQQACLDDPLCKGTTLAGDVCSLLRAPEGHRDHKMHLYNCAAPVGGTLCMLWNDHFDVEAPAALVDEGLVEKYYKKGSRSRGGNVILPMVAVGLPALAAVVLAAKFGSSRAPAEPLM